MKRTSELERRRQCFFETYDSTGGPRPRSRCELAQRHVQTSAGNTRAQLGLEHECATCECHGLAGTGSPRNDGSFAAQRAVRFPDRGFDITTASSALAESPPSDRPRTRRITR